VCPDALPHPIQGDSRKPATALPVVERIKAHGSAEAKDLAAWLGAHLIGAQLVECERYLVVPSGDRCAALEASMRRIGLPLERIQGRRRAARRPRGVSDAAAEPIQAAAVVDVGASDRLTVDGEFVRAFDLGKLPTTIVTDCAAPLLDGDLPLDVSIDIRAAGPRVGQAAPGRAQERAGVVGPDAKSCSCGRADRGPAHGV